MPWQIDGAGGAIPIVTFDQANGPIRAVGYRLGGAAYSSDISALDAGAIAAVRGCNLWIINALRWTRHPTHTNIDQALHWISQAQVQRVVLTNLHIDLDYNALSRLLPSHIEVGFDGWNATVEI